VEGHAMDTLLVLQIISAMLKLLGFRIGKLKEQPVFYFLLIIEITS
jgi:hypothetical protein